MGRKASVHFISRDPERRDKWALQLFPYFQAKGIKEFNMNSVAKALGVSKATVYKYFQSREDILEIIIGQILKELSFYESCLKNNELSYIDRYLMAIEVLGNSLGKISLVFMSDLKKFHPPVWQKIISFSNESLLALREFYGEARASGEVENYPLNVLMMGDQLFFNALLDPEFLKANDIGLQEAFEGYFKLKCMGMKPRK